ncbi:hypothetical protein [Actinomycetospora straminea]|uniref:Uncharacterized protein n=1 Tax=Actinomycetospora straminea TaxID=663607 RepID=A0ABP9EGC3_9PSEU|nr:hypothetical protein [Actinomycetospora straminea]MDD7934347.1 hypothetical protein [Actinomycetospora straminea]
MNDSYRSSDELKSKVKQWLVATGYPLEMRVATVFRARNPMMLTQGGHYLDPSTGGVRETDIEVLWMQMTERLAILALYVIVECKAGDQPWVLFADPDTQEYIEVGYYNFAVSASAEPDDDRLVGSVHDQILGHGAPLFEGPTPACYGIVQMKGRPNSADKGDERNEAYDAVRQAASGAVGALRDLKPSTEPPSLHYAVPVVVTTHPLYISSLDAEGEVVVEPTDSGCLLVRPAGSADSILVHVLHESGLERWADLCEETASAFEGVELHDGRVLRPARKARRLVRRIAGRS